MFGEANQNVTGEIPSCPKYGGKRGAFAMTPNRFTIRNIDPEIFHEARVIAVQNRLTLGEFLSDALHYYIENLPTWDEDESEPEAA